MQLLFEGSEVQSLLVAILFFYYGLFTILFFYRRVPVRKGWVLFQVLSLSLKVEMDMMDSEFLKLVGTA